MHHRPTAADPADLAAIPVATRTALRVIRLAGGAVGKPVLISGAAERPRRFAIQLARLLGADYARQLTLRGYHLLYDVKEWPTLKNVLASQEHSSDRRMHGKGVKRSVHCMLACVEGQRLYPQSRRYLP